MNKDININKNKPAPEVAGALGNMLTDSTSQITVIIPESANLKNYDLLTIHWASLSEESTDKSYPLPITKEKAGKSYSYVISEEKIKKINSTSVKIWYSVQQAGSIQTQISDILTLIIPSSLAIDKRIVYAKIHPGIGVGRVGNSENEFYIGPEYANAAQQEFGATRDRTGAIKRQAARFRIYGYNKQGVAVAELTPDVADIEWKVELANKKSSWYEFYAAMDQPKTRPVKRRNPLITGEQRKQLEIKPSPKTITGKNSSGVQFDDGKFKEVTVNLGELRTDDKGRLLVLGGHGKSASPSGAPLLVIDEDGKEQNFNNSVDWYDDISDGPVSAKVKIEGKEIPVTEAWVFIGPPDYAPGLIPFRSMYDMIKHSAMDAGKILPEEKTSYAKDILPLLQRLSNLQWANLGFAQTFGPGGSFPLDADLINELSKPENDAKRFKVYERFRSPDDESVENGDKMKWPQLYGDGYAAEYPSGKGDLLAVDKQNYKHLENFVSAKFNDDMTSNNYVNGTSFPDPCYDKPVDELPIAEQPAILDKGPLSYCLADAFHPGCELTWPMRHTTLYSDNDFLRIKRREEGVLEQDYGDVLTPEQALAADGPLHAQGPGDLTRWMAMPWQGDTARCRSGYDKEFHPYMPSYWPARVPNEIFSEKNYKIFIDTELSAEERDNAFQQRDSWLRAFLLEGHDNETVMQAVVSRFDELGIVQRLPAPEDYSSCIESVFVEQLKPGQPPLPEAASAFGGRIDGKPIDNQVDLLKQAGWTEEKWDKFRRTR